MRGDRPQDALAMVALAAGVAVLVAARHAGDWIAALERSLHHTLAASSGPRPLLICLALVGATVAAVLWRRRVCRDLLADRVELQLVPSPEFDPPIESVARLAAQLARTRRRGRGWLERPAAAVRFSIASDASGRLGYRVSAPAHAKQTLHAALGEYSELDIHQKTPPAADANTEATAVARCELVLARPSQEPLGQLGLDPDPLQPVAAVMEGLRARLGERAQVSVDVLALTTGEARRWRHRAQRRTRRQERRDNPPPRPAPRASTSSDPLGLNDLFARPAKAARRDAVAAARHRETVDGLRVKAAGHASLLAVQLLIETRATDHATAKIHLRALLSCFDQFAAANHWRAVGLDLPGLGFTGSDGPLRRRGFDRRLHTGRFAAPRRNVVTAAEIAGLLKPPTKHCGAPNVIRSTGSIPPAPTGLPTFTGQGELLPLGQVSDRHGTRTVGVPLKDTFFSYMAGRSRYGKTELGLVQFIHLARAGHGGLFLDPHADAIAEIKHYLTDPEISDRVIEINLAGPAARQREPGWNPLAMAGQPAEAAEAKVEALVDAFASALQWDERNTRALALTTQSAQALIELSIKLPAETAPTLFQISTLLGNPDWREAILPHVSVPTRRFFTERFPRLPAEAITPVTNLIDRLRASTPVAALLGSSSSTYNIATEIGLAKSTVSYHLGRMNGGVGRGYAGRRVICEILGRGGLRVGELCDLKIGQVRVHDPNGARLRILDAKTETGIREVQMTPDLTEAVIEHLDRLRRAGRPTGPTDHLIPSLNGARISRQRVAQIVAGAAKDATEQLVARGLPPLPSVTPHTMRRTYISIALLANNFDVKWVMSQVGHADSKMTMDVYAQLEQRVDPSHGTSFDTLIRKARHQPATTPDEPEPPQRTLHAVA